MIKSLLCDEHNRFLVVEDPDAISELVKHASHQLWIDVEQPTPADMALLQDEFSLHPLAVEDATIHHQRPKIEQYANFYFVVFYSVEHLPEGTSAEIPGGRRGLRGMAFHMPSEPAPREPASEPGTPSGVLSFERGSSITAREISMFLGENYLITVHEDPIPEFDEVARRWYRNIEDIRGRKKLNGKTPAGTRELNEQEEAALQSTIAESGHPIVQAHPGTGRAPTPSQAAGRTGDGRDGLSMAADMGILLYSLLDTLVDGYFPMIDLLVDRIEDLEQQVFEHFSPAAIESIFALKKDLLTLRKVLAPERDVLNVLTRRDLPIFEPHTLVYFQDVYDHVVRITDSIDTYRDLLSSALDSYLSMQSNRLNVVVQTLTSFSIILMSVAMVTGWYGMNFQNMPELASSWGYPGVFVLVLLIVSAEVYFFKRRGWL